MKIDPVRQVEITDNAKLIQEQLRYYTAAANIAEAFFAFISGEMFCAVCRRATLLVKGVWLPAGGYGDSHVVAALMDLSEQHVSKQLNENAVARAKPGTANLFRFSDIPGASNAYVPKEKPTGPKRIRKRS